MASTLATQWQPVTQADLSAVALYTENCCHAPATHMRCTATLDTGPVGQPFPSRLH